MSYLDVSNNRFLYGTLPVFVPLTDFVFSCSNNYFWGSLPQSLENYSWLVVDNNDFTGPLPQLSETMKILDVHGNRLTGFVPEHYPDTLTWYDISYNSGISGTLPETVCNISELQSFLALGCSVSCFHPCFDSTSYFDYMTPFGGTYSVCDNVEIQALCELDQEMGISTNLPRRQKREYLAESFVEEAIPFFATHAVPIVTFYFDYWDFTDQFSRFEIIFDAGSLSLDGGNQELCVYCSQDMYVEETFCFKEYLPGERSVLPFSRYCPYMRMSLVFHSTGNVGNQPGAYFTVNRYVYSREWDCANASYRTNRTNPCEWYGEWLCSCSFSNANLVDRN